MQKMIFDDSIEFAQQLDKNDLLKKFRDKFFIPILHGKESIYFNLVKSKKYLSTEK